MSVVEQLGRRAGERVVDRGDAVTGDAEVVAAVDRADRARRVAHRSRDFAGDDVLGGTAHRRDVFVERCLGVVRDQRRESLGDRARRHDRDRHGHRALRR